MISFRIRFCYTRTDGMSCLKLSFLIPFKPLFVLFIGKRCYATGWGRLGYNKETALLLQEVSLSVLGKGNCNYCKFYFFVRNFPKLFKSSKIVYEIFSFYPTKFIGSWISKSKMIKKFDAFLLCYWHFALLSALIPLHRTGNSHFLWPSWKFYVFRSIIDYICHQITRNTIGKVAQEVREIRPWGCFLYFVSWRVNSKICSVLKGSGFTLRTKFSDVSRKSIINILNNCKSYTNSSKNTWNRI